MLNPLRQKGGSLCVPRKLILIASRSPLVVLPKKVYPRGVLTAMGSSTHPWRTLRWISRWGMSDPCCSSRQHFSLEQLVAWWFPFSNWISVCVPIQYFANTHIFFSLTQPSYPLPFLGTEFGFAQTCWNYCVFSGLRREPCIHSQGAQFSTWLGSRELLLSSETSDGSSAPVAIETEFVFPYNISQTARLFFSLIRPSYPLPFFGTKSGFAQTCWNCCVFSGPQ